MYTEEDSNPAEFEEKLAIQTQQNMVNQFRTAQHLFHNANFNNCNFTFQNAKIVIYCSELLQSLRNIGKIRRIYEVFTKMIFIYCILILVIK